MTSSDADPGVSLLRRWNALLSPAASHCEGSPSIGFDALRQKGGAPEEKRAEAKAIREKYRAQRDDILTPEQRTKAAQMREKLGPHGDRKGQGPGHREKAGE